MKTIVITGPESTGKTLLSEYLARELHCPWIPEYAREYVGTLERPYSYKDLEHIFEMQVSLRLEMEKSNVEFLILDTWLIITKIWFLEVFKKYPLLMDREIEKHRVDLYLVCKPDIPWLPDPLRENGGEKRDYLLIKYMEEIKKTKSNFVLIGGVGEERLRIALLAVKKQFNLPL